MKSGYRGRIFLLAFWMLLMLGSVSCASEAKQPHSGSPPLEESPVFGNANAPVKIVEFTDFECPFCGEAQPALQEVLRAYPNQVSLIFKNFPLSMHRHAHTAHLAAMCAYEQGKFWEYRNILFQNQRALKRTDLVTYAERLGLHLEPFGQCLDEEKYALKIEQDFNEGIRRGVMGTPTFLINGKPFSGPRTFAGFRRSIEEALAERS